MAPNFVLPNLRPAKYPPTSLKAMQSQVQKMKLAPVVMGRWIVFGRKEGILEEREVNSLRRLKRGWTMGARRVGCAAPRRRML